MKVVLNAHQEVLDLVIEAAIEFARQCNGPVAHLQARAYVYSLGGNSEQAHEAERRVWEQLKERQL